MKIEKEEVEHVAHLARLDFRAEETEKFTAQLNDILIYMDKLNEVDIMDVIPMSHAITVTNAFREDVVKESLGRELSLANAPEARGDCFLVPRVVE